MMHNKIKVQHSKFLDELLDGLRAQNLNDLEVVERLNKIRLKGYFYGYGSAAINRIVADSPRNKIVFDNVVWRGKQSKHICLFKDENRFMISYPSAGGPGQPVYDPEGSYTQTFDVKDFWNIRKSNDREHNHATLLSLLKNIYLNGLLDLKRQFVSDIKKNLSKDVVNEFVQLKRVSKTQSIMNISIATGTLLSKIENYQKNIAHVQSAHEAQALYNEVETSMLKLKIVHDRNVRSLNKTKLNKKISKLIETD
jgi:hypothetical protein